MTDSSGKSLVIEAWRTYYSILVFSLLLFRFTRENVCSPLHIEPVRFICLFCIVSQQRKLIIIQTLRVAKERTKLLLVF